MHASDELFLGQAALAFLRDPVSSFVDDEVKSPCEGMKLLVYIQPCKGQALAGQVLSSRRVYLWDTYRVPGPV